MKLFNLTGTFETRTIKSEGNPKECWLEAEGNRYYLPSRKAGKFVPGQVVRFCAFVSNSVGDDLIVGAIGHTPYEASDIISYGIGDDAGLNENEICFTKSNNSYHRVTLT